MKPFDLEKAADGQPVMTKIGLPARVICVDANNPWAGIDEKLCVIALVEEGGLEQTRRYNEKGEHRDVKKSCLGDVVIAKHPDLDLVMRTEKHEGWVNIYPGGACGAKVYPSEGAAIENAGAPCVGTVKIEWEE